MIFRWLRYIPFKTPAVIAGLGLAVWLLAAPQAGALSNRQQILIGGGSFGGVSPIYTSPGLANLYGQDFPSTGKGETAAQARMSGGGVLSVLFVRLQTQNVPSSGSLTVTVRVNGADTAMTCTVGGSGQCAYTASTVTINNGDRLAIQVTNDFTGAGNLAFNYSLLFD
jgi:hypothetical protein